MGVLSDSLREEQIWLIMTVEGVEHNPLLRYTDYKQASYECANMNRGGLFLYVVRRAYGPED